MSRRAFITCLLAAGLAVAGCHTCRRQDCTSQRPNCGCGYGPAPARIEPAPRPLPAFRQPPAQPPIARNDDTNPATFVEPNDNPSPPNKDADQPNPPTPGDFPAEPDVKLLPPRRAQSPYRREVAKPWPNDNEDEPKANIPGPRDEDKPAPKDDTESLLNVKQAIPGVRSGIKPFPEDFPWLAKKGNVAILNLREPDSDDSADRRMARKYGLKYRSLGVAPIGLDRKLYDEFVKLVTDKDTRPLYVYDYKEGAITGGLWYLYFRREKGKTDEEAQALAKGLGLDFKSDKDPHQSMLLAVEKFLRDNP